MQFKPSFFTIFALVSAVTATTTPTTVPVSKATVMPSGNDAAGYGHGYSPGGGYSPCDGGRRTTVTAIVTTTAMATTTKTVTQCPTHPAPPPPEQTCPVVDKHVNLRRMDNPTTFSHFYSTYGPEVASMGPKGFHEETPQGHPFLKQVPNTVPLWRCALSIANKIDYYYTTNTNELQAMEKQGCKIMPEPGVDKGVGYVYTKPLCGAVPLYRLYSPTGHDHFLTVNAAERDTALKSGKFVSQGTVAYIPPP